MSYFNRKLNKNQIGQIKELAKVAGIKYAKVSPTKKYIEIGRQTRLLDSTVAAKFLNVAEQAGFTVADPDTSRALIEKGICDVFMVGL